MFSTIDRFKMAKNKHGDWEIYDLDKQERLAILSKNLGELIPEQVTKLIDLTYPETPLQSAIKEYKDTTKKEEIKYKNIEKLIKEIISHYDINFSMEIYHDSYNFILKLTIDEENEQIIDKMNQELDENGFSLIEKSDLQLKYLF